MTKQERRTRNITRSIALPLGVGGAFGCGITLWLFGKLLFSSLPMISTLLISLFLLLFAACAWAGWELWKDKPRARTWAKILLALQIPVLSVPGFTYKFYTGLLLSAAWSFNESKILLNFYFGSSFEFKIFSHPDDVIEGINLVALIALTLLFGLPRREAQPIPTYLPPDSTPLNPKDFPPNP